MRYDVSVHIPLHTIEQDEMANTDNQHSHNSKSLRHVESFCDYF